MISALFATSAGEAQAVAPRLTNGSIASWRVSKT